MLVIEIRNKSELEALELLADELNCEIIAQVWSSEATPYLKYDHEPMGSFSAYNLEVTLDGKVDTVTYIDYLIGERRDAIALLNDCLALEVV